MYIDVIFRSFNHLEKYHTVGTLYNFYKVIFFFCMQLFRDRNSAIVKLL